MLSLGSSVHSTVHLKAAAVTFSIGSAMAMALGAGRGPSSGLATSSARRTGAAATGTTFSVL